MGEVSQSGFTLKMKSINLESHWQSCIWSGVAINKLDLEINILLRFSVDLRKKKKKNGEKFLRSFSVF